VLLQQRAEAHDLVLHLKITHFNSVTSVVSVTSFL
jgi:hypothetical protein